MGLALGAVLITIVLSSCLTYHRLGPEWYLHVENLPEANTEYEVAFEPCVGGLRGKLTLPEVGIVSESERIPANKEGHKEFLHRSRAGDPIVFEAWCYGESQVELGYVKRETRIAETFTHSGGGSLVVYPPTREPSLLCISATETRGNQLPCLTGFSFDM